jgi:hypothetical protein
VRGIGYAAVVGACAVVLAGQAHAAVLYDQTSLPATGGTATESGINSQNYESGLDQDDDSAADDFTVPAGQTWKVTDLEVLSHSLGNGMGPASFSTFLVTFYASSDADLPVTPGLDEVATPSGVSLHLPGPVTLGAGHYWVAVVANLSALGPGGGTWYWENRSVTSGSAAVWQNPGNAFSTGCTAYTRKSTCMPSQTGPDQLFRLVGSIQPTLTVVKTGAGTGTVTAPGGIDCGAACSATYDSGASTTLTAKPAVGSTFAGWSGATCSGTGSCQVTIGSDTTVTATFDVNSEFTFVKVELNKKKGTAELTVNVPGPGKLSLSGKTVKDANTTAADPGDEVLKVKATGKAKEKLADKGKVKVPVDVTFTPTGGDSATRSKTVKLKRTG